jgi:CheY-like chemotaxis protein
MSGHHTDWRTKTRAKSSGPILIVDDDLDDAKLVKRAIEKLRPEVPPTVRICASGKEFIAYLEGVGAYSDRAAHPLPSIVLLDLKMPEMDGFAVLEWIKAQPKFSQIPVVVISGFEDVSHLRRAYSLNASSYLAKPVNMESFRDILSSLNVAI